MQHLGRREAFALGSANAVVAAGKAKAIATYLDANGWESTLAKYKPGPIAKAQICSVGEFLADVVARGHIRPRTLKIYATKLRKIVADITEVEAGTSGKAKRAKFDYVNGGTRHGWRKWTASPSTFSRRIRLLPGAMDSRGRRGRTP